MIPFIVCIEGDGIINNMISFGKSYAYSIILEEIITIVSLDFY
jgi:CRISPR/Cas system-associated endonuclease Cas1